MIMSRSSSACEVGDRVRIVIIIISIIIIIIISFRRITINNDNANTHEVGDRVRIVGGGGPAKDPHTTYSVQHSKHINK